MATVILPVVPNVCKVIMHGSKSGHTFINTWYAKYGTFPTDQAGANAVAAAMATAYWNAFGSVQATAAGHVSTQVIDLATRTGITGVDTTTHSGTHAGAQALPVNVACCISWVIADRYRGGHPRIYLPAADGTDIGTASSWSTTSLAAYQNAANGFHAAINALTTAGTTWQHVAVRYFSQNQVLPNPYVRPVNGTVVHTRVDTQRRRLGKESA